MSMLGVNRSLARPNLNVEDTYDHRTSEYQVVSLKS